MKKEINIAIIDKINQKNNHQHNKDYSRPYLEIPVYQDNYFDIKKEPVKENRRVIIIDLNI